MSSSPSCAPVSCPTPWPEPRVSARPSDPPRGGRSRAASKTANLPRCGGDVRQDREGREPAYTFAGILLIFALLLSALPARAEINTQFRTFLENDLWPEARSQGISRTTFDRALGQTRPNLDLPDLVRPGHESQPQRQHQAEFGSPGAYFAENIVAGVTGGGRRHAQGLASTLQSLEQTYGVPGGIVLAVWGRESAFGNASIPHSAFEVLATRAFLDRRRDMFRAEVLAALRMVENGYADPATMRSSWAGAMGQPQFMPTSYLRFARAADGSQRADIWNSQADTLASIAHYLAAHGWVRGRDWGFEVRLPANVSCALEGPDRGRSIAEWASMGIERVSGRPFPDHELGQEGFLMMPAGRHGPAFIVTTNFYVLKAYNESDLYALFVGHAGDRIRHGDFRFTGQWGQVGGLMRSDVAAMQAGLQQLGHDTGGADGLAGFRTRRAIGAWQESNGQTATCFPDSAIVGALR